MRHERRRLRINLGTNHPKMFLLSVLPMLMSACLAQNGYVANYGEDTPDCGFNISAPCRTLQHMTDLIGDYDHIYPLPAGSGEAGSMYDPGGDVLRYVPKTFLVIDGMYGYNEQIRIHHTGEEGQSAWTVEGQVPNEDTIKSSEYPSLKFYRLSFTSMAITVKDTRLYVQQCSFQGNTKLYVNRNDTNAEYVEDKVHMKFEMIESIWDCYADCSINYANANDDDSDMDYNGNCRPACLVDIDHFFTHTSKYSSGPFEISDCAFLHTALRLNITLYGDVEKVIFRNNSFASGAITTASEVRINVSLGDLDDYIHIYIEDCSFENISTVLPDHEGANVRAFYFNVSPLGDWYNYKRVFMHLDNLVFIGNHRALTVEGSPIEELILNNSIFRNNFALQSEGAALHLRVVEDFIGTDVTIVNCIFENNMAGFVPDEKLQNSKVISCHESIKIKHSNEDPEELHLMGMGGAVALYEGKSVSIQDSTFTNNSAHNFGGSIFQASPVSLTITNVFLETSGQNTGEHGDVIYALGYLFIESADIVVHKANALISIVEHSLSKEMSLTIFNMSLICPVGYFLDVDKASALNPELYVGYNYGDKKDFAYLDRITLTCQPCKRGLYSIEYGYLELETSDTRGIEVVKFEHKDITCRACPYGGICEGDIRSVQSYWGYIQGNEIVFEHCIQGQCCYTEPCPGYDYCAGNRQGILCSQCLAGYSRATFSQLCVPDSDCGLWWFWPLTLMLGLVYALFLLFQDDIVQLITILYTKILGGAENEQQETKGKTVQKAKDNLTKVHTIAENVENSMPEETTPSVSHQKNNDDAAVKDESKIQTENDTSTNDDPDYLQIMVNFVQDAALFYVTMPNTSDRDESLIVKIFGFTLSVMNMIDDACFQENLNAVQLLLIKAIVGPTLIMIFITVYLVLSILNRRCSFKHKPNVLSSKLYFAIRKRLPCAFMLTLLFSFQSLLITSLTLLDCIEIGSETLLKIDTTIECGQTWQHIVLGYVLTCSVPFPILLMIVPSLLKAGIIKESQILYSSIFPLPFIIIWLVKKIKHNRVAPTDAKSMTVLRNIKSDSQEDSTIYNLLQGPFRDINVKGFGSISWTGITMTKRSLLCLMYTFISNSLIRVVALMIINLLGMLQLFFHHPYKQMNGNRLELFLSGVLLMIGMANVVRGAFESAQYIPKGPDEMFIDVIETIESVLLQWVPLALGGMVLMYAILKGAAIRLKKKYD